MIYKMVDEVKIAQRMETPREVELRLSGVEEGSIGIWCKSPIEKGMKFGPFVGDKVLQSNSSMDSTYVWEIVDLETREFLFYIDATNPEKGNWMRYINCARYYEEQNIVSQQEGIDIFYTAIKDIAEGEELLTWYESKPMNSYRRQRRPKKPKVNKSPASSPEKKKMLEKGVTPTSGKKSVKSVDDDKVNISTDQDVCSKMKATKKKKKNSMGEEKNASIDSLGNIVKSPKKFLKKKKSVEVSGSGIENEPKLTSSAEKCVHEITKTDDVIKMRADHNEDKLDHIDRTDISENNVHIKEDIAQEDSPVKTEPSVALDTAVQQFENNSDIGDEALDDSQESIPENTVVTMTNDGSGAESVLISEKTNKSTEKSAAGFYQFSLLPCHVTMGKTGQKVYKCDICSGDYRHAFSLKRHYIRNHINYRFVSEADLLNCNITTEQQEAMAKRVNAANCDAPTVSPCQNGQDDVSDHIKDSEERVDNQSSPPELNTENDGIADVTVEDAGKDVKSHSSTVEPERNICILNIPKQFTQSNKGEPKSNSNDKDNKTEHCPTGLDCERPDVKSGDLKNNPNTHDTEDIKTDDKMSKVVTESPPATAAGPQVLGLYRCNICDKLFHTRDVLKTHIQDHPKPPSQSMLPCDHCDMQFSNKHTLLRHQAMHSGAKQFTCVYCGKNFSSLTNQKRHEKIHEGQKLSCKYCQRTFTQSGDLKKHIRRFHTEHYFECNSCGKYFLSKNELNEHLTTHTESQECNENDPAKKKIQPLGEIKTSEILKQGDTVKINGDKDPDVKFLCSVCRKEFKDYQVLCHHQRVAHRRSMIDLQQIRKDGVLDDKISMDTNSSEAAEEQDFEAQATFFENVAKNIADNLNHYIDGKEEHLDNYKVNIKCEFEEMSVVKEETDSVENNLHLSKYNFPPGYDLSQNSQVAVSDVTKPNNENSVHTKNSVYNVCKRQIESIKLKTQNPSVGKTHESLSREAPVLYSMICSNNLPANANAGSAAISNTPPPPPPPLVRKPELNKVPSNSTSKTMAIRVPQIHTCLRCKCIFHNAAVYADHMLDRHNINVDVKEVTRTKSVSAGSVPDRSSPLSPDGASAPASDRKPVVSPAGTVTMSSHQYSDTDIMDLSTAAVKNNASTSIIFSTSNTANAQGPTSFSESLDLTESTEHQNSLTHVNSGKVNSNMDGSAHAESYPCSENTKFVCSVCNGEYDSAKEIVGHQKKEHRNVVCTYVEVDKNFEMPLAYKPSALGILGSTMAVSLPTVSEVENPEQTLTCTKCMQTFTAAPQLHKHILDCAGHWKKRPYKTKKRKYKKRVKKIEKTLLGGSQVTPEITDESSQDGVQMKYKKGISRHQFKASKKRKLEASESLELEVGLPDIVDDETSQSSKRRRNYELLYNPQNHVRRRERINILDMHKCNGCSLRFESISNLERHVKVCAKKDQLKVMPAMKSSFSHEDKLQRHKCRYCSKQFTYHGSLRKHVNAFCSVRISLSKNGHIADSEWKEPEYDETDKNTVILENTSENGDSIDGESKEKGRGGWPKGRKRKGKRRNHGWGYSRKKLMCELSPAKNNTDLNSENVEDLPSSLESSKTTDDLQSSNSSSRMDFNDFPMEEPKETMDTNENDAEVTCIEDPLSKDKISLVPSNDETKKKVKRKRKKKVIKGQEVKRRRTNVQEENPYKRMYRRRSSTKTLDESDQVTAFMIISDAAEKASDQTTKRRKRKSLVDDPVSRATYMTSNHGDKRKGISEEGENNNSLNGDNAKKLNISSVNEQSAALIQMNDANQKKRKKKKKKKPVTMVTTELMSSKVSVTGEVSMTGEVNLQDLHSVEHDKTRDCVLQEETKADDEMLTKEVMPSNLDENSSSAVTDVKSASSLKMLPQNASTKIQSDNLLTEAGSLRDTIDQTEISDPEIGIPHITVDSSKQDSCFANTANDISKQEYNVLNLTQETYKQELAIPGLSKDTCKQDTFLLNLSSNVSKPGVMPGLGDEASKQDLNIPSLAARTISIPCAD